MIKYVKGDLFEHIEEDCIISHCCNDSGAWGAGFVLAINKNLGLKPRTDFINASKNWNYDLGDVNYSRVKHEKGFVTVANMCGQHGVGAGSTGDLRVTKPIRYAALVHAMEDVARYVNEYPQPILAPKFGSVLAGGNWEFIRELIEEIWGNHDVTIFEL
jgi:O-acetyl-ADP-ribose deacetylase (regulator of RNase III)